MEKLKELLDPATASEERKDDEDTLYGKDAAGAQPPEPEAHPLAQGHIQDPNYNQGKVAVSAPAELMPGMTGQYITGRDVSPIADQEKKKHGTAVGLGSATMASGAVGHQDPST